MDDFEKSKKLISECMELSSYLNDRGNYLKKVENLGPIIDKSDLGHILDYTQLKFMLEIVIAKEIGHISKEDFEVKIMDLLQIRIIDLYYHITELFDFPDNYRLGFATLFKFQSLSSIIQEKINQTCMGEISNETPLKQLAEKTVKKLSINEEPNTGMWAKISVQVISDHIGQKMASNKLEESLDILRIVGSGHAINTPEIAIEYDNYKKIAFPSFTISIRRVYYDHRREKDISDLSDICVDPKNDLERRVKNTLHFHRIGDNYAPDYQRLFYYVAGIEQLILGANDRDVLRWKFSEKASILLGNNLVERLELFDELKELYDRRSKIAHGSVTEYDFDATISSDTILHNIIHKILFLRNQGIETVEKKKSNLDKSLEEYIDKIIFNG